MPGMTVLGHFDPFPPPRLSGRCRFSQGTFAGTCGNGEDAPETDCRSIALELLQPTVSSRSVGLTTSGAVAP